MNEINNYLSQYDAVSHWDSNHLLTVNENSNQLEIKALPRPGLFTVLGRTLHLMNPDDAMVKGIDWDKVLIHIEELNVKISELVTHYEQNPEATPWKEVVQLHQKMSSASDHLLELAKDPQLKSVPGTDQLPILSNHIKKIVDTALPNLLAQKPDDLDLDEWEIVNPDEEDYSVSAIENSIDVDWVVVDKRTSETRDLEIVSEFNQLDLPESERNRLVDNVSFYGNTSLNTLLGAGVPANEREVDWEYETSGGAVLTLRTEPLPDELLENFNLAIEGQAVQLDEANSTLQSCGRLIENAVQAVVDTDSTKEKLLAPEQLAKTLSGTLQTLCQPEIIRQAREKSDALLNLGEPTTHSLTTQPVGLIGVDVALNDQADADITFTLRQQLVLVAGDEKTPLDLFSTTTITNRDGRSDILLGPFETAEGIEDDMTWVARTAPSEDKQGIFAFKDHELKRRKYESSMERLVAIANEIEYAENSDLDVKLNDLKAALLADSSAEEIRVRYRAVLDLLRACVSDAEFSTAGNKAKPILDLVKERFMGNRMYDENLELVTTAMKGDGQEALYDLPWEEQFKLIGQMPDALGANRLAVNIAKLRGTVNVGFDPNRDTNVPYANYSFQLGDKERTNLRFGTQTQEGYWLAASIVPEFDAFIQGLQLDGKKHLYINLQNRNPKWIGDESGRCKALEGLATKYPGAFSAVTLAQDTSFYKQSGETFGVASMGSDQFINHFLDQMFVDQKGGFFFSQNVLDAGFNREVANEVFREVNEQMFDGKDTLTLADRQAFIECAYTVLTKKLLEITDADTFNMSCKDAIDRGGKCSSLLFYYLGAQAGKLNEASFREEHMVITHAPALIVKKQAIIGSRRSRLIQALNVMGGSFKTKISQTAPIPELAPIVCRKNDRELARDRIAARCSTASINVDPNFAPVKVRKSEQEIWEMGAEDLIDHVEKEESNGRFYDSVYVKNDPKSVLEYDIKEKGGIPVEGYSDVSLQMMKDISERPPIIAGLDLWKFEEHDRLKKALDYITDQVKGAIADPQLLPSNEIIREAAIYALNGMTQAFEDPGQQRVVGNAQTVLKDLGIANRSDLIMPGQVDKTREFSVTVKDNGIHVQGTCWVNVMKISQDIDTPKMSFGEVKVTREYVVALDGSAKVIRMPDQYDCENLLQPA